MSDINELYDEALQTARILRAETAKLRAENDRLRADLMVADGIIGRLRRELAGKAFVEPMSNR